MSKRSSSSETFARHFSRKRGGIALLTLALAIVVLGVIGAWPAHNAAHAANAKLGAKPLAGGPGTQLSLSGNGFGSKETVNIYWNYTGPGTGTFLGSTKSGSNGGFKTTVTVPTGTTPGLIPVAGVGQTSNITATVQFYLYPSTLALAPLSGSANTSLTLSAYGFQGFENVNIYWNNDSQPLLTEQTNIFGYMAPTTITVPVGTQPGSYPVTVVGQTSQLSITNTFTVVAPGSNLSLSTGPVGVQVNVTGEGYAPGESVNVLWDYTGPGTGNVVATVNAGISGTVGANFTVPTASVGSYKVAVVGVTSGSLSKNTFSLTNGLSSSPATTPPGTSVTVAGTGFQAGETVNLYWGSPSGQLLATTTADSNGNISKAVTTPSSATPGATGIAGVGQSSGKSYTAPITIDTDWGDFGFDLAHHRQNPYENVVGTSNASSLKLKWKAPSIVGSQSSPVYANGIVYMGSFDGILKAYDSTTDQLQWQFDSHTGFETVSAPLVDAANGMVFFGTVGARQEHSIPSPFFALNAQTGALIWSLILPWDQFGFPTLAFNTIYLGTAHQGQSSLQYQSTLDAIDEFSGQIKWQYATPAGVWGAVATNASTNTVFTGIGDPAYLLIALDATTGAIHWQYTAPHFGNDDDLGSGIVVNNGLVYVSSKNGFVYAIHESDGSLAWSTKIAPQSSGDVSSPVVGSNGVLYVGSVAGVLYALNATTGSVLWKGKTSGGIDSSPALANGVVYVASYGSKIYAFDATNGKKLWGYTMGGKSYSSPIIANGWLYCGSGDGNLYAFSLS